MIERQYGQRHLGEIFLRDSIDDCWEPWMKKADEILDDEELIDAVYEALRRRRPNSATRGRKGTPAEVALRLLVLKHMRNWSFDILERELRANMVYRMFTRVGAEKVPDAKTLARIERALGPEVFNRVHDRIVGIARERKVAQGRKMRIDTTVTETNIHYPTDSSLLGDGVRVLTRTMKRIVEIGGNVGVRVRERIRSVSHRLLVQQVMRQTKARVFNNDVHASDKIVSLFETATQIIRKGKTSKPTEFGRLIKIQEAENQIITDYEVCAQRPADNTLLVTSIEVHRQKLGRAPHTVATDAAFYSQANETAAKEMGVQRVAIPNRSTKSAERRALQKKRWFRRAQAWRTGCEGRISVLKRRHGLDRCRYRGDNGMKRWVGLGVIADNLINIGRVLALRASEV